jgi:exodeoxyribonuclease VIII
METQTRKTKIDELVSRLLNGEEPLSYSSISNFAESPKHFIEYKLKEKKSTDAMIYGSVVHCLVLEEQNFEKRYAVAPTCDRRTTIGKNIYSAFIDEAQGREVISQEVYSQALETKRAIRSNFPANNLLKQDGQNEIAATWEYLNFKFRGFIDKYKAGKFILDLKTCADASPRKFQRDIIAFDYHLQAAMYLTAIGEDVPYYLIAADKSGGVSVHLLDERLINLGRERYAFLMENLNRCILLDAFNRSFDFYSDRGDGIFVAEKPAYLY